VLLACGDTGAGGVVLTWGVGGIAALIWVVAARFVVKTAPDRRERRWLVGLLILFVAIGPLVIAAFYAGFFGSDDSLGKLALLMLIPAAAAAFLAQTFGVGDGFRAFLVSAWGSVFLIGLGMVLFFAAVTVGGACLE
jgi:hypothetical protein